MRATRVVPPSSSRLGWTSPALAVALLLVLSGCGGADEAAPATSASQSSPSSASPSETTSGAVGDTGSGDDCGVAVPEMLAATSVLGSVKDISVSGCDVATVTTDLGTTPDDVLSATGVCSYAAHEASGHGVAATSVVAADGTELARGTTGDDCAGVPAS